MTITQPSGGLEKSKMVKGVRRCTGKLYNIEL